MSDDRPQDQGRRHRKRGDPSGATATLLGEYQEAMRAELRQLLVELRGRPPAPGLGLTGEAPAAVRPALAERAKLWDLAIKLGRELGTEVDAGGQAGQAAPAAPAGGPARGRRIDFGRD